MRLVREGPLRLNRVWWPGNCGDGQYVISRVPKFVTRGEVPAFVARTLEKWSLIGG
jgi:hypothetical protein